MGLAKLSDLKIELKSARDSFQKYGEIHFQKLFRDANWGDTIKYDLQGKAVIIEDLSQFYRITFPQPVKMWETVYALRKLPEIEFADPPAFAVNEIAPNDQYYQTGNQWYLSKIQAEDAWNITTGSSSVIVAVIDEGVDASHPDLSTKLTGGESGYGGAHGTKVAGLVGAATNNNSTGIASLGWNVMIRPYNHWNGSDFWNDISMAVSSGAKIINCSWKMVQVDPNDNTKYINFDYPPVRSAVLNAISLGRIVVAAAGNPQGPVTFSDGVTRDPSEFPPYPQYPAANTGVIAVSPTNNLDQFPSGYNYGSFIKVSAPGISILTTDLGGIYSRYDGTSLSTPLVSAAAGLIWSLYPSLTATQIANAITLSSDDLGSAGWDDHFGYGRLNAYKALKIHFGTLTANQTWTDYNLVLENVTVQSGVTLTMSPGATVKFAPGTSLTVNGTLNANGSVGNMITFDAASGQWSGIIFNSGSSGSLSSCYINHASQAVRCNGALPSISHCFFNNNGIGLYLNNVGTPTMHISYNEFNYGQGIFCYSSSPYIDNIGGPTAINYTSTGITCILSSPTIAGGRFYSNTTGIYATANSSPIIGGYNRMWVNSTAISVEGPCYVGSSMSDVYQSGGSKAVRANSPAIVGAQYNYWGQYPPNSADFVATNGATIYWQPGNSYPWTGPMGKTSAIGNSNLSNASQISGTSDFSQSQADQPSVDLDQSFFDATKLLTEGKYEEARSIYTQELKFSSAATKKQIVLSQLAECYRLAGRKDFIDFLNTDVRSQISKDDDLYATTLELENLFLIPAHDYQKALENLNMLKTHFAKNGFTERNALFNLGYIHTELLADAAKGKEYYDELKAKYPDEMLTWQAKLLLGEIDSIPSSAVLNLNKEVVTKTEIPASVTLLGNYPNPFNPSTVINYQLPGPSHVSLKVYDILGREVASLIDGMKETGYYSVTFDGSGLSSGIYFTRMIVQQQEGLPIVQVKKMQLVK